MNDPAFWARLQFAFTITYHYLFPQLTMGLAPMLVFWKWRALRTGDPRYARTARFWAKIFGLTFAVGVVTGIPMEFQFGTNWADFSKYSGNVIGQTLAMEGMFAFFLESALVGALVWGEKRLSPRSHFLAAMGVALGSWLSGYFILVTNAFMQHPVGHALGADGRLHLASLSAYLANPWALIMFAHNQAAALVTGSFVVAGVGAFYGLRREHREQSLIFIRTGVIVGLVASLIVAYPTGDAQAKLVAQYQPPALAAMEGHFHSASRAELNLIGQPNVAEERLDNPIRIPGLLSFLAFGNIERDVPGLDSFPREVWPTDIEVLYYSFHIMAGLGTLFLLLMGVALLHLWRDRILDNRVLLWVLMISFPFPFIANTAGWATAELGRQPWLIYNLFRTNAGVSKVVSAGDTVFTLIGFLGLYFVVGILYLSLFQREMRAGPTDASHG
jgi:cytochrome bd ubiquinol oxidase subunit I